MAAIDLAEPSWYPQSGLCYSNTATHTTYVSSGVLVSVYLLLSLRRWWQRTGAVLLIGVSYFVGYSSSKSLGQLGLAGCLAVAEMP
jgi:hypothetical protein